MAESREVVEPAFERGTTDDLEAAELVFKDLPIGSIGFFAPMLLATGGGETTRVPMEETFADAIRAPIEDIWAPGVLAGAVPRTTGGGEVNEGMGDLARALDAAVGFVRSLGGPLALDELATGFAGGGGGDLTRLLVVEAAGLPRFQTLWTRLFAEERNPKRPLGLVSTALILRLVRLVLCARVAAKLLLRRALFCSSFLFAASRSFSF